MGWLIFFVTLAWLVFGTKVNPYLILPLAIVIAFLGEWVAEIFMRGILNYQSESPTIEAERTDQTGLLRPDQDSVTGSSFEPDASGEPTLWRASHLDLGSFELWEGFDLIEARCTKCGFRQQAEKPLRLNLSDRQEVLSTFQRSDPCHYALFAEFSMRRDHDLETASGKHFEVWSEIKNLPRGRKTELRCQDCGSCMVLEEPLTFDSVKRTANRHLRYHSPQH